MQRHKQQRIRLHGAKLWQSVYLRLHDAHIVCLITSKNAQHMISSFNDIQVTVFGSLFGLRRCFLLGIPSCMRAICIFELHDAVDNKSDIAIP